MSDATRLTLACLLWARPGEEAAMTAYEDEVLALLPPDRARVLERVVGAGADGTPHEVQLYRFDDQAALDDYLADPRRTALTETRDRVVARTELFPVQHR